jgi:hypothetical protein
MPPDSSAPPATQQAPDPNSSQTNSSQTSVSQSSSNVANATADQRVVEGCVQQNTSDNSFSLRDDSGNNYKLTGDTSQLSAHINEQVQVTGTLGSQSQSAASSSSNGASTSANASEAGSAASANGAKGSSPNATTEPGNNVSTSSSSNVLSVQSVKPIASVCRAASK